MQPKTRSSVEYVYVVAMQVRHFMIVGGRSKWPPIALLLEEHPYPIQYVDSLQVSSVCSFSGIGAAIGIESRISA